MIRARIKWIGRFAAAGAMIAVACGETLDPVNPQSDDSTLDGGGTDSAGPFIGDGGPPPASMDVTAPGYPDYCSAIDDATFCWSFDRPPEAAAVYAGGKLNVFEQTNLVGIELADGGSSLPFSLRVRSDIQAVTRGLEYQMLAKPRRARCRLTFIVDEIPPDSTAANVDLVKLTTNANNANGLKVTVQKFAGGPTLQIQLRRDNSNDLNTLLQALPKVWLSLFFEVHFKQLGNNDSGLEVSAVIDGGPTEVRAIPNGTPNSSVQSLVFGLMGSNNSWSVRYDDVVCVTE